MYSRLLLLAGMGAMLSSQFATAAETFFLNRITTRANVEQSARANTPGAVTTLVAQDLSTGVDVDSYASLDIRHTAYQSYSGFNAVRVGVVSANGLPENLFTSETVYNLNVTSGPPNDGWGYRLYLDYMVLPGAVGLSAFAPRGSRAGVSFTIEPIGYLGSEPSVGKSGALTIEKTSSTALATTIDPVFIAAGTQPGSVDLDGFRFNTIESLPFFDTAYLGHYDAGQIVEIQYAMSAWVSIPGYELGGFASIGDPFALRADSASYLASVFPGGTPLVGLRVESAAPVPEAQTWAMLLAGLVLLGARARRLRTESGARGRTHRRH